MSEKEIIKKAKKMIDNAECWIDDEECFETEEREWAKFEKEAIEGMLDLYNKEKEKNKKLKELLQKKNQYTHDLEKDLFEGCSNYVVRKDEIREKMKEVKELSTAGYEILKELLEGK